MDSLRFYKNQDLEKKMQKYLDDEKKGSHKEWATLENWKLSFQNLARYTNKLLLFR